MHYDPFCRGPHPVGVRTVELEDTARGRTLPVEVWYPADIAHAGEDLGKATRDTYVMIPGFPMAWQQARRDAAPAASSSGHFPLALFSHGFAGHRRQSTFLCTHLASHGWIVAATDHGGNTFKDLALAGAKAGAETWKASMAARPEEIRLLIDAAGDGRLGVATDTARVAMTGHSFGGWTSLRVIAGEPRIAAVAALAPAVAVPQLRDALDVRWKRNVPVLVIAAERDSLLPLEGIEAVHRDLPPPATLVVLTATDHMHFCDGARQIHEIFRAMPVAPVALARPLPPFDELAPARAGHESTMGLVLAHLEAGILDRAPAAEFMAGDLSATLGARGISARSGVHS